HRRDRGALSGAHLRAGGGACGSRQRGVCRTYPDKLLTSLINPAHLFFNVLSIPAVDLDLPFDSRIGLRCRGPVVRAFRPEWDRTGIQGIRSSIVAYRCYTSPMARPLRLEFARALYHVTARGRS